MSTSTTHATPTQSAALTRATRLGQGVPLAGILPSRRRFANRRTHVGLSTPDDF